MSCTTVREALAERALSVLPPEEAAQVDRHLEWCAGCRKEAAELQDAAATFGLAMPPANPPAQLGDRIAGTIQTAAGKPTARRPARSAVASVIAAMLAVAGLGWGNLMAGRADRITDEAAQHERTLLQLIRNSQQFQRFITDELQFGGADDQALQGRLIPSAGERGGGAVLLFVSPTIADFALVVVDGLPEREPVMPYRVLLVRPNGATVRVGRINRLDGEGGAELFRQFATDGLQGFSQVRVLDDSGAEVLRGEVSATAGPEALRGGK